MLLEYSDWIFHTEPELTKEYYFEESGNRCECGFCRNYFATVDMFYPDLRYFLTKFNIDPEVPEILLPFRPTLYQASYYVFGRILRYGRTPIMINGIAVTAEEGEEPNTFLLHLGLMELPWVIEEDPSKEAAPASMLDFFTGLSNSSSDTLS